MLMFTFDDSLRHAFAICAFVHMYIILQFKIIRKIKESIPDIEYRKNFKNIIFIIMLVYLKS